MPGAFGFLGSRGPPAFLFWKRLPAILVALLLNIFADFYDGFQSGCQVLLGCYHYNAVTVQINFIYCRGNGLRMRAERQQWEMRSRDGLWTCGLWTQRTVCAVSVPYVQTYSTVKKKGMMRFRKKNESRIPNRNPTTISSKFCGFTHTTPGLHHDGCCSVPTDDVPHSLQYCNVLLCFQAQIHS
jgi:hypothetical protein